MELYSSPHETPSDTIVSPSYPLYRIIGDFIRIAVEALFTHSLHQGF